MHRYTYRHDRSSGGTEQERDEDRMRTWGPSTVEVAVAQTTLIGVQCDF
jgi:hypothetical protein